MKNERTELSMPRQNIATQISPAVLARAAEAEGAAEDKASMLRTATWRYERNVLALQNECCARQAELRQAYLDEVASINE